MTENASKKQSGGKPWQFKKGQSGNPAGKPKGTRHKATRAVEALMEGEADAITRKAIDAALAGDMTAIKLCLDRIAPPRKDAPVRFTLPELSNTGSLLEANRAVMEAVASGDLTPGEAHSIGNLLTAYGRSLELHDFEERIARLEERRS